MLGDRKHCRACWKTRNIRGGGRHDSLTVVETGTMYYLVEESLLKADVQHRIHLANLAHRSTHREQAAAR